MAAEFYSQRNHSLNVVRHLKTLMNFLIKIQALILILLLFSSCNRTKATAIKVKEKTKLELSKTVEKVVEKTFPTFDSEKSDTDSNKKRFIEFIKIELSRDIKNIYCFDDVIGIDSDYMFSFNCDKTTSNKIIELHDLNIKNENNENGFGLQHDFDWWNKEKIKGLRKYEWTNGKGYFKYYWYDNENGKAYYFEFTL